jgi:tRNA dimethylallyltransferase
VRYHLIDIADPAHIYTLYHYQQDAYRVFAHIRTRQHLPILTGGTGLYIEAVLRGYRIPEVAEDPDLRKRLMTRGKEELTEELARVSPAWLARTDLSSKKRIVRALEIAHHAPHHPPESAPPPDLKPLVLVVAPPRPVLHERIHQRLLRRIEHGMIEEVHRLMDEGLSGERIDMLGLEYRHIARYLRGELSYETMVETLEREIRRFAKRQMTWFRGMERRGIPLHWLDEADPRSALSIAHRHGLGADR